MSFIRLTRSMTMSLCLLAHVSFSEPSSHGATDVGDVSLLQDEGREGQGGDRLEREEMTLLIEDFAEPLGVDSWDTMFLWGIEVPKRS